MWVYVRQNGISRLYMIIRCILGGCDRERKGLEDADMQ